VTLTFVALYVVFSGFFAERRLRDRLEDLEGATQVGQAHLQMATLRRVEKQGSCRRSTSCCGSGSPTPARSARSCRPRHEPDAGRLRLRLGRDRGGVAFLLYLLLDLPPGMVLAARC
jgi:tight adherence protein B